MIQKVDFYIKELENMKKYPQELFYIGNKTLLSRKKVSIVGSRRPSLYTRNFTYELAKKLSSKNICIVSGAAIGVDAICHNAAGEDNTIAVVANGLNIKYPATNKKLIEKIESKGLILSQFEEGIKARNYSFVLRNEIVVALGDILIVTEASRNSGSLTSINYALKMNKKVYTLSHRINESLGTQELVCSKKIEVIYDIDSFVESLSPMLEKNDLKSFEQIDKVLDFCKNNPSYDSAIEKFGEKIFEYELLGKIRVDNGTIFVK